MIYDYEIKEVKKFDRNEPYWSKHYNLLLANIDLDIKSYHIAIQYDNDTKEINAFLILYETKVANAIDAKRFSNGKYKFFMGKYLPYKNQDYNVNLEYVESRDNPTCHIYRVSVN